MKHILLFEKFTTEYKGYLTGSLSYLYKHKKELENKISNIDDEIKSLRKKIDDNMRSYSKIKIIGNVNSRFPGMAREVEYKVNILTEEKNKLQEELDNVNSEILKYTKK